MIHIATFHAAFLLCAWYAWTAGGRPERLAMFAQAGALLLTDSTGFINISGSFGRLATGWAVADGLLLLALTALALRADRIWPIVLASLQLSGTMVHATKLIFPELPATGYAIFVQMWSWPMLVVTAIGTYNHQRRLRPWGSEPDWKPNWAGAPAK